MPVGNQAAHAAFRAAMSNGAMHHAWLFAGPQGIGKAMFARTAALRLLAEAARPDALSPGFDVPADDPARALIAAGSHPDFRWLGRLPKDAEKPDQDIARSISIAQVRSLQPLFTTTPTMSPRRVVVIDAADDLERPGASNALLKNLEEPPTGTVFILVSHAPGRLLPTIRSRCRRLRFDPLTDDAVAAIVREHLPDAPQEEIAALTRAGGGSPGRALSYAGMELAALDAALLGIAESGDPGNAMRAGLAKALSPKAAQPRYEAFLDRAPTLIAEQARGRAGEGLQRALDAYENARALSVSARALSLDVQGTVFEMAGLMARLARPD